MMDEEFIKHLAKELARLSIRVNILQSELILLKDVDHEYIDGRVEDALLSRDGRLVYESMLLALRDQPPDV
jgi:hypothetical protein